MFVKWVANSDQNDWATEEILTDGTHVRQGEPVDLSADQYKEMVGRGRVFEDSSVEEAKKRAEEDFAQQPVGKDVAGTAPVFSNTSTGGSKPVVEDEVVSEEAGDSKTNDKTNKK